MGSIQARLFSTDPRKSGDEQSEAPKSKSKFFAFLQKAEDVDRKVQTVDDLNFELDESDIAFDSVSDKKDGSKKKFMELSGMQDQSAEP